MNILDRIIDDLRQVRLRVDALVARAVVELVNDTLKTQRLQVTVLADDPEDDVEHFQPYGVSFVPPAGAEAIALAPSGSREGTVVICVQHPDHRPRGGDAGTGGLYTAGQWRVFIDPDGNVHLGAEAGAAKLARDDRTEAALNEIWTVLQKPCANGVALAVGPRTSPGVGADRVRGT